MTNTQQKCCEKCQKVEGEYFDTVLTCQSSDCRCHTQQTWRDRFREKFVSVRHTSVWRKPKSWDEINTRKPEKLEEFIEQELTTRTNEIVGMVEEILKRAEDGEFTIGTTLDGDYEEVLWHEVEKVLVERIKSKYLIK